jgi:hypothetical protein
MSNLRTVEFRDTIDEFLSTPPGNGLGLEIGQVVEIMRVLMLFSGAAAAAAMVLAIYVLQRNRAARVGYTIAAVAILLTAPAVGGFLPVLIAFSAIMLWTRPARDWFAGRPVTAGSGGLFGSRPSGTRDGTSLSSSDGSDAPRHLGGDSASGDSSEPGPPAGSSGGAQAWPRMPEGSSDRPTPPPTEGFGAPGAQGRPDHPGQPGSHQGGPSYPQGGYPPPYGQPGQQGSWPPQYGQPPYGGPGYGQPYPQQYGQRRPGDGDKRPASVTTAAWITWALSVLTLLGLVIIAVVVVAARGQFLDLLRQDPTFQQMNVPAEQVIAALWVMGAIAVFWSVAAMVLAWFAYRRANWARITLVVSAVISGLLSLAAFPVGLLNTVGSLAVVVLLFVGGANEWYARRAAAGQGFPGPFPPYGHQERQTRPDDQRGQPPYGPPAQEPRSPQDRDPSRPPSQPSAQPSPPPSEPPSEPSRGRGKDEPPSNVW